MREEMRGLFLAIVLSIVAIFITNRFFPGKTVPAAAPAVTEEAPLPQTPLPQEKIKADELIAAANTAEIMASAEAVGFPHSHQKCFPDRFHPCQRSPFRQSPPRKIQTNP